MDDPSEQISTKLLISLAVVVVALVAIAGVVVLRLTKPTPKPRVVVLPVAPSRPAAKPTIARTTADLGEVLDTTPSVDLGPASSRGCGRPAPPEMVGRREKVDDLTGREVNVYVPSTYDESTPYPVLLLFHDAWQTAAGFWWDTGFEQVAEEHGLIVMVPRDRGLAHWKDRADFDAGRRAIERTEDYLCLDYRRIFAVGHGAGAEFVEKLRCQMPELAGFATTSYRSGEQLACSPREPIPHIHLAGLLDRSLPPAGGKGCGAWSISLDAHEQLWRDENSCGGERRELVASEKHTCWTWDCEVAFASCHMEAGRGWPLKDKRRDIDVAGCDGEPPVGIPMAETIWNFFASQARGTR